MRGLLYTAKGTAALLVPVANYMQIRSPAIGTVCSFIAAGAKIHRLAACYRRSEAEPRRWSQGTGRLNRPMTLTY